MISETRISISEFPRERDSKRETFLDQRKQQKVPEGEEQYLQMAATMDYITCPISTT